jgi:hypothetical protein
MDETSERAHLAQADNHIAAAERHIVRQKQVVADLERGGHETDLAVSLLYAFEHALHAFKQHREVILVRLKMPD